jgi:2-polyprenyl-3-methyl-5-hydroxy-6-metoxy-1,4-benzoquinol methylase
MKFDISNENLAKYEKEEIEKLLLRQSKTLSNDLEQIWYLMDLVWDDYGCDNNNLDWDKIGKFYAHPVWLLNGLFIEQHEDSMQHRHAISDWVVSKNFNNVVDYGGGFGTLARLVAQKDESISINIYEPYPSDFGLNRAAEFDNISIVTELDGVYDCLISTEVLEHVPDPLSEFYTMIKSVKVDGYLIVSYDFNPVINCHLPFLFHFRYNFFLFGKLMGLKYLGTVSGYSSAKIFRKHKEVDPNWKLVRYFENLSKILFTQRMYNFLEILRPVLSPIKRIIIK